jgi:hypothetical protein
VSDEARVDRRKVLKCGMAGMLTLWSSPLLQAYVGLDPPQAGVARDLQAGVAPDPLQAGVGRDPRSGPGDTTGGVLKLTDRLSVLDGGGSNVVALSSGDGILLVDSGAPTLPTG